MFARFLLVPGFALAALLLAGGASAHDYRAGEIAIFHPWARATAPSAQAGAGFMALTNHGAEPDRLVGAASPVADHAELHTHINDNGVMRMRPVEGGIALPPGQTVTLAPGGLHVMLLGLHGPLQEGSRVPLTLTFEHAGNVTVELAVEAVAARGPDHGAESGEHGGASGEHGAEGGHEPMPMAPHSGSESGH